MFYINVVFYNVFLVMGLLAAVCFGLWYGKKYNIPVLKVLLLVIMVFVLLLAWTSIHFLVESGFTAQGTNSVVRAMPYLMLMIWPVATLLKIKAGTAYNLFAPLACLYLGIAQFGCIFAGCCGGYPAKWGIYCYRYNGPAFPIQIIEAISVLAIFLVMLWRNKKCKYNSDGKSLPIMLMIFGAMRFILEFARNNEKIWLGCSALAFHALFMVAVGIEIYCTIDKRSRQYAEKTERYFRNPHKVRRYKK